MEFKKEEKIKIASVIATIAGIFSIIVSVLLFLNYLQMNSSDPTESEVIDILVERLASEPNNEELIKEIRHFDLMARKAYFNTLWQINTGAYLLLIGSIVLIISLSAFYSLRKTMDIPHVETDSSFTKLLSQRWMLIVLIISIIPGLIAGFLSKDYFSVYETNKSPIAQTDHETESVEVIEIKASQENINIQTDTSVEKSLDTLPSDDQITGGDQTEETEKKEKEKKPENITFPGISEINANFNAFRGPLSQGIAHSTNVPVSWNGAEGKNVAWKTEIPLKGYNSPVLWENKLFISGADQNKKMIFCYDAEQGELLWEHEVKDIEGSPDKPPRTTDDTGLAAPTLTTDGNMVYAIFGTGDVISLSMNGNRIWAKNIGVPDNHYGHSSSLIIWKNKLFIQFDTNKGGRIICFNAINGQVIWNKKRDSRISWASPILAEINGQYQIILNAEPIVAGYDINTGEELWQVDCMMGEVGPSTAYYDGLVFAANEYATLVAIDPTIPEIKWQKNEYLPEVSSPVAYNGLLFIATSYGVLACYDTNTGEKYWEQEFNNGFYSSLIIAENHLYATDMSGVTHIYDISKEVNKIGNPSLGEKVVTTPAFMNGKIYFRGSDHLFCIEK